LAAAFLKLLTILREETAWLLPVVFQVTTTGDDNRDTKMETNL
jgi:hypothetical protein